MHLPVGFMLQNNRNENRIIYYQLNRHQFIEIFPETSTGKWDRYDGQNHDAELSWQAAVIGKKENAREIRDPEGNRLIADEKEKYISELRYNVKSLDRSLQFYQNVLFLDTERLSEKQAAVRINEDQTLLLTELPYSGINSTENKGYCHFALIVKDIVSEVRRLESLNWPLTHGPQYLNDPYTELYTAVPHSENTFNFYTQDPDGNDIEVMQYTPESFQVVYSRD